MSDPIPTICIDCRYVGAGPSGISEVVRALAHHAPLLAPDLHFVLLTNPRLKDRLSEAANVEQRSFDAPANSLRTMWMMGALAPLHGVDLFHATFNILPARLPMPSVTTIHDLMWLQAPHLCEESPLTAIKHRFFAHGIGRALTGSVRIAAVSEATRQTIIAHDPALEQRVRVAHSGVSSRFRAQPQEPELLEPLGISPNARVTLVVGQNAPYKNHKGALRGFAEAYAGSAERLLVFVQRRGASARGLARLTRRLDVANQVIFAGSVSHAQLLQLYSRAEVLLHPSLCEGFGNPLVEAMACGCPVITSNISAMPETTGGAARLVDPHSSSAIARALREVCDDRAQADTLSEAGLKRVSELSWEQCARANIALYREALEAADQ